MLTTKVDVLKRRLLISRLVIIALIIVVCLFLYLFLTEQKRTQEKYTAAFETNVYEAYTVINNYEKDDFALRQTYLEASARVGTARELTVLIADPDKDAHLVTFNELYYAFIRTPQQMSEKLAEVAKALEMIYNDNDKGYADLDDLLATIDKDGQ